MKYKEYLNESTSNINDIASSMARLIMGNKDTEVKYLKKALPLKQADFEPGAEYNKAFNQLYTDINKAIKKALNAASGKYKDE